MSAVLRAFILFAVLLVLALLLGQSGGNPLPVTLTFGETTAQTNAPIAVTFTIGILFAAFYLGRLTGWLLRLPHRMVNRRKLAATETLADAYTALALNDPSLATQHLTHLKTDNPGLQDLATLLQLSTASIPPHKAEQSLTNPRLAALASLHLARLAAQEQNWLEVKRVTTLGRQSAPQNLPLLTLQFKSLVNLNDPSATDLLPALKPHLGTTNHKLITQILANTPTPATLANPWVKEFQTWLPTPADTLPPAL